MYLQGFLFINIFFEGKSEVANVQRPLFKLNTSNFLYTVLAYVFLIQCCSTQTLIFLSFLSSVITRKSKSIPNPLYAPTG